MNKSRSNSVLNGDHSGKFGGPVGPVALWVLVVLGAVACGSDGKSTGGGDAEADEGPRDFNTPDSDCFGCTPPPVCDEDGMPPDPYPECACFCVDGYDFGDRICNENSCVVYKGDAAPADADALSPEAGTRGDAGTDAGDGLANADGGDPSGSVDAGEAPAIDAGEVPDSAVPDASESADPPVLDAGHAPELDAASSDAMAARLVCSGPETTPPEDPIVEPSSEVWEAILAGLPARGNGNALPTAIDPSNCQDGAWSVALPLGSAYVHVHRRNDGCEMWLGGETENPLYDGTPTQYCRFPTSCLPLTPTHGNGGPAQLYSPYCN